MTIYPLFTPCVEVVGFPLVGVSMKTSFKALHLAGRPSIVFVVGGGGGDKL